MSTDYNELDETLVRKGVDALLSYESNRINKRDETRLIAGYAKPLFVQATYFFPLTSCHFPNIDPTKEAYQIANY
jgi:hypothetical protein